MSLKTNLFKMTSLSVVDTIVLKILATLSFAIVTHLLPLEHIGIIGVATGYLVFFRLLSVTPESILYRDMPKIKDRLSEYISAFMIFWAIKTIVIMAIAAAASYIVYLIYGNQLISIYFFGSVFVLSLGIFHGIAKETLYMSFKQGIATKVSAALMILTLGLTSLLFFSPSIISYLYISMAANLISAGVWTYFIKKSLNLKFKKTKDTFKIIKNSITDFALWTHIGACISNLLLTADVLVLSFFVALSVIGDYTIALTIANFFFILPMMLQKASTVGLSNMDDKKTVEKTISVLLKYSFILSALQFLAFLVFGKLIIAIFTANNINIIYSYALLILAGNSIINVFRPMLGIVITKINISKHVIYIFLPAAIMGVISYIILTILYGPIGAAAGNIVTSSILSALLIVVVKREYKLKVSFQLLSAEEKGLIKSILSRLGI